MLKRPLSKHYPILRKPIRRIKILFKNLEYLKFEYRLKKLPIESSLIFKIKSHKSVLQKKLGDSDPKLQQQKVKNLEIAAQKFDKIIIKPNQTFSFWKLLGEPKYSKGFVDGMILENGKVTIGLGGGLCQMANLLYWLFLHTPLEIKEHHHHMLDIFPDSGRVLPFGSGAGVFYNYGDLQFKNTTKYSFYLRTWIDEKYLHGEIYTLDKEFNLAYKIIERGHKFYTKNDNVFRRNKIFKVVRNKIGGKLIREEIVTINDSQVLYDIDQITMKKLNQFYKEKELETNRLAYQTN